MSEHANRGWHHEAACADHPAAELWHPMPSQHIPEVVAETCEGCPVRKDCAEFALRVGAEGVYGGFQLPRQKKAARTFVDTAVRVS